jgi:selenoprotein W-related protein
VEVLREELGVEASLTKGSGGIFTVAVDGRVVVSKDGKDFPTEKDIVDKVAAALGR